jgi:RNA polymerase sigma-32 factor
MSHLEGVAQSFVKAAMRAPYLSRDHERELAQQWSELNDEAALHALTQAHMRLVISMAVKFRHYGLPVPDLMQEGHVGLLEAAARFDPSREVRFSTYAMWWIRASIQDYILRNWSIVRGGTSSGQKSLFFNLRRLRSKISRTGPDGDQTKTFAEVALALRVSVQDVEMMNARLASPDSSLNAPLGTGDDGTLAERGDFLVDPLPLPDQVVEDQVDGERRSKLLHEAMQQLNSRELRIVEARRLAETAATLDCLGQELGISKERVRQIESRALEKLKAIMISTPEPLPAPR